MKPADFIPILFVGLMVAFAVILYVLEDPPKEGDECSLVSGHHRSGHLVRMRDGLVCVIP
jgi:hypothetical protein